MKAFFILVVSIFLTSSSFAKIGNSDVPDNMLSLLTALRASQGSKKEEIKFVAATHAISDQDYHHALATEEQITHLCETKLVHQLEGKNFDAAKTFNTVETMSDLRDQEHLIVGFLYARTLKKSDKKFKKQIEQIIDSNGQKEEYFYSLSREALDKKSDASLSLDAFEQIAKHAETECH